MSTKSYAILQKIHFDRITFKQFYFTLQWNATTSYNFEIPREFGTDYGICCWYTPQLNFTEILEHQMEHNLTEPDWSNFFLNIKKVRDS